jgi:phospholipid/cholesterol/gamma-HCH transport system substrate-binding protein
VINRKIKVQLAVFATVVILAVSAMAFGYVQLPTLLFGAGRYVVKLELPESGSLYEGGVVSYRGTAVGRVESVTLTGSGVEAALSLESGVEIPSDLDAVVGSRTAIGEQFVQLLPRNAASPPLRNGNVIPRSRASVPPGFSSLLDAANQGLTAINKDDLKTTVDESYAAFGGLGPEIARIVKGTSALATDARLNLDELTTLIDDGRPLLHTQTETSESIQAWAAHLADITKQLQVQDTAVASIFEHGPDAAREAQQLFDRLKPTLPIIAANLVSVGQVAITYQNDVEQLLVLIPQGISLMQAMMVANKDNPRGGVNLSFNLNVNVPPPCTTGFLPGRQIRNPIFQDSPQRPEGDLYCRIPQDASSNVRGARNIPCESKPGKRAPTVKICESDEPYIPLNDGTSWKGDPNATLSGQDVPQVASAMPGPVPSPAEVPALGIAEYDPTTGMYLTPNGKLHTQADLAQSEPKEKTWQQMLVPPVS